MLFTCCALMPIHVVRANALNNVKCFFMDKVLIMFYDTKIVFFVGF